MSSVAGLLLQGLRATVQTPWLVPIWGLETLNYVVHALWRPVAWNLWSQTAGYALWALQLACFFRCQLVAAPESAREKRRNPNMASMRCRS